MCLGKLSYMHLTESPGLIVYKKIGFLTGNIFGVMFTSNLKTFPKPAIWIFKLFPKPAIFLIQNF